MVLASCGNAVRRAVEPSVSILLDSKFADHPADLFGGEDVVFVGVEDREDGEMLCRDFGLFEFSVVIALAVEVSDCFQDFEDTGLRPVASCWA